MINICLLILLPNNLSFLLSAMLFVVLDVCMVRVLSDLHKNIIKRHFMYLSLSLATKQNKQSIFTESILSIKKCVFVFYVGTPICPFRLVSFSKYCWQKTKRHLYNFYLIFRKQMILLLLVYNCRIEVSSFIMGERRRRRRRHMHANGKCFVCVCVRSPRN